MKRGLLLGSCVPAGERQVACCPLLWLPQQVFLSMVLRIQRARFAFWGRTPGPWCPVERKGRCSAGLLHLVRLLEDFVSMGDLRISICLKTELSSDSQACPAPAPGSSPRAMLDLLMPPLSLTTSLPSPRPWTSSAGCRCSLRPSPTLLSSPAQPHGQGVHLLCLFSSLLGSPNEGQSMHAGMFVCTLRYRD